MTPAIQNAITTRSERAAKKAARVKRFVEAAERSLCLNDPIENEARIRALVLSALHNADGNKLDKSLIFRAVYAGCGRPPKHSGKAGRTRRTICRAINLVLEKLYLEGAIHVQTENTNVVDTNQRTVSIIYLRPTNDIPVNRIAASVFGPVWGSTKLL